MGEHADIAKAAGRYDAIVIGSGPGGASLTLGLVQRGLRVLLVESGGFMTPRPAGPDGVIGEYIYDNLGFEDPVAGVGGRSRYYGAALYRLRENDFREIETETGISPAWPVSYADLAPYYERAEIQFKVHGSPDGDPSEPPRAAPYPYPPLPHQPVIEKVIARLHKSGTVTAAQPRGLDYGPGGACVMCATCDGHMCRLGAKMDAETAAVRPALATGLVDLLLNTECVKVLTDEAGEHVTGVLLRQGEVERTILSGEVVVAAGMPGSALLLRRSRTERHPEGLGNNTDQLGRWIGGHHVGTLFAMISAGSIGAVHTKTFAINTFYDGAPDWNYPLGIIQVAGQMPIWKGTSKLKAPFIKAVVDRALTVFYMTEAAPSADARLIFEDDRIARRVDPAVNQQTLKQLHGRARSAFRRAGYPVISATRATQLWHDVGSARMGDDPRTSVTDRFGRVHGVGGLHVSDASTLVSAGAVNTALTIIALAMRTADAIADGREATRITHAGADAPGRAQISPEQPGAATR